MALVAGTVTVDDAGVRTGSGLALALYDAERASHPPAFSESPTLERMIPTLQALAAKCEAQAAAHVAAVGAADVRIVADAIDAGIPSITRVLAGAVE